MNKLKYRRRKMSRCFFTYCRVKFANFVLCFVRLGKRPATPKAFLALVAPRRRTSAALVAQSAKVGTVTGHALDWMEHCINKIKK